MNQFFYFILLLCVIFNAIAKDPAEGWLSYAVGTNPAGTGRITFMEA